MTGEQKIKGTFELKVIMGSLKVIIDDHVEKRFRRVAMRKFGYGRGALSDAAEAALAEWSSKEDLDENLTGEMEDPVAVIEGLLKEVKETSVRLQHEAPRIRARRARAQAADRRQYLPRTRAYAVKGQRISGISLKGGNGRPQSRHN